MVKDKNLRILFRLQSLKSIAPKKINQHFQNFKTILSQVSQLRVFYGWKLVSFAFMFLSTAKSSFSLKRSPFFFKMEIFISQSIKKCQAT
jgi:hypothetical protein